MGVLDMILELGVFLFEVVDIYPNRGKLRRRSGEALKTWFYLFKRSNFHGWS